MKAARQIQDQKEEEAEVASKKAAKAEEALKKLKETSFVLPQGRQSANPLPQSDKLTMISSLLYAGQQSLEAKRYKEAEKHYLNAYKLEPENAMISYNLGILYGEYLKDYSRAEKFYRKYLVLAPNAADSAQVRSWLVDLTARSKW